MTVTHTPGVFKAFHRSAWGFQQTVKRAEAKDLDRFISAIIAAHGHMEELTVTIDQIVFNTHRMTALCRADSALPLTRESSVSARSLDEIHALLLAAFWDGMDCICIPQPKPFVFYADHHEMVTFYAHTKSHLNHIIEPLSSSGYKLVENWRREF